MALPDFRVAQTVHGGNAFIVEKAPTAAETFLAGQPVFLVAAGTVTEFITDETTGYGIALEGAVDLSGTLRASVRIAVFDGNTIFSGRNTGAAFVFATHQGDPFDHELSGSEHGVDVGTAGSNDFWRVLDEDPTDSSRVLCTVDAANSQFSPFGTALPV